MYTAPDVSLSILDSERLSKFCIVKINRKLMYKKGRRKTLIKMCKNNYGVVFYL